MNKTINKIAFVDFDGTICPNKNNKDEFPPPNKNCVTAIKLLKEQGYEVVIYSVRSNAAETNKVNGHVDMIKYLRTYHIPYDAIDTSKPHFSIVIDDKCLGIPRNKSKNVKWSKVLKILKEKHASR